MSKNLTEDLSFSRIVDIVQHDEKLGAEMLVQIAKEKELVDSEISDVEIKLQHLKNRELQLRNGSLLVLKHLEKETPLAVQEQDFIVVITKKNITIERNVLKS